MEGKIYRIAAIVLWLVLVLPVGSGCARQGVPATVITTTPAATVPTIPTTVPIYQPTPTVYPDTTLVPVSPADGREIKPLEVSEYDWRWENPLPQGNALGCIWGFSPTDVYAVGSPAGMPSVLMHYDGRSWSTVMLPISSERSSGISGIWGSSPTDIFAVGGFTTEAGQHRGFVLHYDGRVWRYMLDDLLYPPSAIWGSSSSDVFAVGWGIYHYDGVRWSQMVVGNPPPALSAVWGFSSSDVFAVGSTRTLLHYDGKNWKTLPTQGHIDYINDRINDVWGNSPTDVYAVGQSILHWDGQYWRSMGIGNYGLTAVWGTSPSDIFAINGAGVILFGNGSTWKELYKVDRDEAIVSTADLWGSSRLVYATNGSRILRYDGNGWIPMTQGTTVDIRGVGTTSSGSAFAVGGLGYGEKGAVLQRGEDGWEKRFAEMPGTPQRCWVADSGDLFAVTRWDRVIGVEQGMQHTYRIVQYNSRNGAVTSLQTNKAVTDVWGTSSSNVFAVGSGGTVYSYNGGAWTPMASGTTQDLRHVWGTSATDVYAVGKAGTILHYAGHWLAMEGGRGDLNAVWGTSSSDLFAVGDSGVILHYDGNAWQPMTSGTSRSLYAVGGTSSSDVFAVGQGGTILRFDGKMWVPMKVPTNVNLIDVLVVSPSEILAVGDRSAILRLAR